MCSSGVFIYETEDSEITYLAVHVTKPPRLENETRFFNSDISTKNSVYSLKNLKNADTTYVFTIDMTTGGMCFYGLPNIDLFPSPTRAWESLSSLHKMKVGMPKYLGSHLIGATIEGNTLYILSVEEKEEVAIIFDQPIYRIKKTNVYTISWDQKGVYSTTSNSLSTNKSNSQSSPTTPTPEFLEFEINKCHYFSPTLDLSSPFPYPRHKIDHNYFCWNKRFVKIFEEVAAFQCCIVLLQGTVLSMNDCKNCNSDNIIYILKRSSSNSGTRYLARGMNEDDQEPANECECELIFVDNKKRYYSHSWRRGSPPIFWGTDANLFTQKNIVNKKANESSSYGKTHVYFLQDIFVRFDVRKCHVISFLKNVGTEKDINDAYEASINEVNHNFSQLLPRPNSNTNANTNVNDFICNINFTRFFFDNIESKNVVEYFIEQLMNEVQSVHFNQVTLNAEYHKDKSYVFHDHQDMVYRFNCADSLDRTNVGTFAFAIILTSKYANDFGLSFRKGSRAVWFEPFKFLKPSVINFLCKAFTKGGNIVSKMYANTAANRNSLIKQFFVPEDNEEDFKVHNDVVNIFWRNINSIMFDKKRQHLIFQWLDSDAFRRKRFSLDQQHIGFYQLITHEANKARDNSIDDLSEKTKVKRPSFVANDEGLYFIDESILSDVEKCFVLSTQNLSTNEVCVVFPEPVVVCAVSFLIIPQTRARKTPSFDLFISDQIADRESYLTGSRVTFMHGISLPIFIDNNGYQAKKWVTYDLIEIAKRSSQFPLDPESLRLSRFAKIRFNINSDYKTKKFDIANIKFSVKVPSNPRTLLFLKGHPPDISVIEEVYRNPLNINSSSYMEDLLQIEKKRTEKGISNYHRNNILVARGINPWNYDFPSQFLLKKNAKRCLICKSRFTEKNRPLYFISHKLLPQFFIEYNDFIRKYNISVNIDENSSIADNTQKIIEMMNLQFVRVCNACKDKLVVLSGDQEKLLTDTVFVKVDVTKEKLIRNFKAFPLIPNTTTKSVNDNDNEIANSKIIEDFTFTLNSNHVRIFNPPAGLVTKSKNDNDNDDDDSDDKTELFQQIKQLTKSLNTDVDVQVKGKRIIIGMSFVSYFHPSKITLTLNKIIQPSNQANLKVMILMKIPNSESQSYIEKTALRSNDRLSYTVTNFNDGPIKFFDLIIDNEDGFDKKKLIEVSIKRIMIHGKFELLKLFNYPYSHSNSTTNLDQKLFPVNLPKFIDNKNLLGSKVNGWDDQTRTQKIPFNNKESNVIIFKPFKNADKNLPMSLIIAYYDEDDSITYCESLIVPSWIGRYGNSNTPQLTISNENDTSDQFIFPIKATMNASYILIFYLDRMKIMVPYKVALAKV